MKPFLSFILLCTFPVWAESTPFDLNQSRPVTVPSVAFRPGDNIQFIENKGQITDQNGKARNDIQFSVRGTQGVNVFMGNGAIHYQFSKVMTDNKTAAPDERHKWQKAVPENKEIALYRLDVELVGGDKNAQAIVEEKQAYYENYFSAATNGSTITASAYSRVTYKNVYPGIDWVFYMANGHLKHEFVVRENGNPANIRLRYDGATQLAVNTDGSVSATTPFGTIAEQAPVSYQQDGAIVKSSFVLQGNELSYHIAPHSGTLTIDPSIAWATYFGGTGSENAQCVSIDAMGNVINSGITTSTDHIATIGAHLTTYGGAGDCYLAKFSSAGALLWATYYGGDDQDVINDMNVDAAGNIYMVGATRSVSGIATAGSFQPAYAGGASGWGDAFIAKFSAAGTLLWGTYWGGSSDDVLFGVKLTSAGDILAGGYTTSAGMATPGAYINTYALDNWSLLAKFSNAGSLLWATYCEGTMASITADASDNIYVAGYTDSADNVATAGAHQATYGGGSDDGYLAKFSSSGFRIWGTFYGGNNSEQVNHVAVDGAGYVYITGYTASDNAIATPGAYKTVKSGTSDAFLAKFRPDGTRIWGTYYGGESEDLAWGVVVDHAYNVFIAGATLSDTGIATPDGYQQTNGDTGTASGFYDAFLVKLDSSGTRLWSTYYGGEKHESVYSVAVSDESIVMAGYSGSMLNVATPGAYQATEADGGSLSDVMLVKFNNCVAPTAGTITGPDTICNGASGVFSATAVGGSWSVSDGAIATVSSGTMNGISAGIDTLKYAVTNACGTAIARKVVFVASCPVEVNNISQPDGNIQVFPNPATDYVTVVCTDPVGQICLRNITGKVVYSGYSASEKAVVPTTNIPVGIYILQLRGRVFKIVKND